MRDPHGDLFIYHTEGLVGTEGKGVGMRAPAWCVLLLALATSATSNLIDPNTDPSVENALCPAGTWTPSNNRLRYPQEYLNANGGHKFCYYPGTDACLIYGSNALEWQNTKNRCGQLTLEGNSIVVALAIPTTATDHDDWGWQRVTYWGNAKRLDSTGKSDKNWNFYEPARQVADVDRRMDSTLRLGIWDTSEKYTR